MHNLPHGAYSMQTKHGTLQIDIDEKGVNARFPQMLQYGWSHIDPADVTFEKTQSGYVARFSESNTFDAWDWHNKSGYHTRDYRLNMFESPSGELKATLQTTSMFWKKEGHAQYTPGEPKGAFDSVTLSPLPADRVY